MFALLLIFLANALHDFVIMMFPKSNQKTSKNMVAQWKKISQRWWKFPFHGAFSHSSRKMHTLGGSLRISLATCMHFLCSLCPVFSTSLIQAIHSVLHGSFVTPHLGGGGWVWGAHPRSHELNLWSKKPVVTHLLMVVFLWGPSPAFFETPLNWLAEMPILAGDGVVNDCIALHCCC